MNDLSEIKMELNYIKKELGLYTLGPCYKCDNKWVSKRDTYCFTCDVPLCPRCIEKCSYCKKRGCDKHHHRCDNCECGYCMDCLYVCKLCGPFCPELVKCEYDECVYCPTCYPLINGLCTHHNDILNIK